MSDGSRKRIKLKLSSPGSKSGSPRDSRAGSPDVPATVVGSRAASPGKSTPQTWRLGACFCVTSFHNLSPNHVHYVLLKPSLSTGQPP